MKKFIVTVLAAATFFVGLGGLVDGVGAKFKSDEKALELIKKARLAIGGDAAINNVRSMTITGKATKTFEIEGAARSEQGDLEINFELPDKMSKMLKLGDTNAAGDKRLVEKRVEVVVVNKGEGDLKLKVENPEANPDGIRKVTVVRKDGASEEIVTEDKAPIILRRGDGDKAVFTSEDGKTISVDGKKVFIRKNGDDGGNVLRASGIHHRSELFRLTLSLLLSAPEGSDVSYRYAGEGAVDGAACEIIDAQIGGASIKLYLDKTSNLPRMMTYQGAKPFMIGINKDEAKPDANGDLKVFTREMPKMETAEFQVKFSDYRSVNGLQMPFRWTQTAGGKADETVEITSYEINPANIAEKFKDLREVPVKTFVRALPENQ